MAGEHCFFLLKEDKPREACGVFGIFAPGLDVARLTYYGLYALQHRGQESAGIAVGDGERITCRKGMGLVGDVFAEESLSSLSGHIAIGHVRYATTGESSLENAQPFAFYYKRGMIALAHNGNLTNYAELRRELSQSGSIFQTTSDSELIVSLIAGNDSGDLTAGIQETMRRLCGAYSLILTTGNRLYGIRDPYGIRPLCLGRLDDAFLLASESCALDTVGAEFIRDVRPGEIVMIDESGITSLQSHQQGRRALCVFEFVYFARPDSVIDGLNVQKARYALGRELAREYPLEGDLVIPAPDSGVSAALSYASARRLPFGEGLIKNRYVGRTFIRPTQQLREMGVKLKLNPVRERLAGKRVILLDDSIVRGTTSGKIIQMLRDVGAKELHMLVSSPAVTHCCYYGIDTSREGELIAAGHSVEEIRRHIGADTLHYLSLSGMQAALAPFPREEVCDACFSGDYPLEGKERL
jgi:amidophosphoribosyltransferase